MDESKFTQIFLIKFLLDAFNLTRELGVKFLDRFCDVFYIYFLNSLKLGGLIVLVVLDLARLISVTLG